MTDQRPWLTQYPAGIPANIDLTRFTTLKDLLADSTKQFGPKPAFSCMGKTITFAELDKLSDAFGAYLHYRGLQPGDKVALMMPNLLQYPIALHGVLKAGLVIVNTNPLYTPREMKHQFADSGAKAVVIAENFAANLQQIIGETDIKTVITTSIGELLGFLKGGITNFVVRNVKKMVPAYDLPGAVTFQTALDEGAKHRLPAFTGQAEDTIALQYTGGTTGVSKGAMLTNANLVANALQSRAWMTQALTAGGDERMLCPLPLYHIFAFTVNSVALFSHGICNVLITNPRDLSTINKAFKDNKIAGLTAVNTLFNALINDPGFQGLDFRHLKIAVGGGMAVQRPVAEGWQKLTGVPLSEGYGLTETSPSACMNPLNDKMRIGTIGVPLPSTEMRIWVEEENRVASPEERGEIHIKGPQVMKGYYNRPEATAEVITTDGWLRTGDIGVMSADGFFRIVDRLKDMILVSGFNVFPNEVEDVLAGHPGILEVAAIGVPNEKSGEVVKVFVVKKDKSLKAEDVINYAKENLTGYKVPKEVEFRDDLPKSNVGKIIRRHLRDA
ncbi:AMP-binding protein [Neolewinella lacunae]|uniref:Long-chain-fatty-acid--CoA ligase n=1 Tax=Neolewinella lacunae TaxID=1517758 RepID=A0A923TF71_9BACT|nr:AMP-binding protein [Neolewinella lacunae]MBC6996687.1 AMP-binding protein [Neolewinella lacunae]MDN3633448.1 AMP-binding protein [Neolewinella lacunae]